MSDRNSVPQRCVRHWPPAIGELGVGLGALLVLVEVLRLGVRVPALLHLSAAAVYLAIAALVAYGGPARAGGLGWANRVTLARAVLIALVAGTLPLPHFINDHHLLLFVVALVALCMDGLDGLVARHTDSATHFGARFDMELDAFFILALCLLLVVQSKAGPWVIAIGAMRYLFVLAAQYWHWLEAELPVSYRRKTVCVIQLGALMLCLLPGVTPPLTTVLLAAALVALLLSFLLDIIWLRRRSHIR
ncbi:CDP-alcohol phosphatidyltransferase family protein [Kushneria aurantia]|uniref:CDP-alcohol phosphatidyltransferase family protein n=1 Tax=Kushneria aurantia TaxID=504092 RepID=A0ABV6FZH9_9GAMM|nr:CDP-alcohol phosphatidyltransferase family protein [Kushneria aurantia]